jgi:hypothetical protein
LKNLGTGEYMHIENQTGSVQCTAVDLNWWSSQWSQDNVDGTYVRIRNRWQTGSIVHVEGQIGSAQYANAQNGWYSAQWQLVTTSGRLASEENSIEASSVLVDIYPNPSNGKQFNIEIPGLPENELATLAIHDMSGKIALERKVNKASKIDHNLPPGLYIIKVRATDINAIKKLMIE